MKYLCSYFDNRHLRVLSSTKGPEEQNDMDEPYYTLEDHDGNTHILRDIVRLPDNAYMFSKEMKDKELKLSEC